MLGLVVALLAAAPATAGVAAPAAGEPGTLDPTFGIGGWVDGRLSPHSVEALPGGRLATLAASDTGSELVRYLADGAVDTAFGTGGSVALRGQRTELRVGPGGEFFALSFTAPSSFGVCRYDRAGRAVTSYGGNGCRRLDGGETLTTLGGFEVQGDGKAVLLVHSTGAPLKARLARLTATGDLDPTFGRGGWADAQPPGQGIVSGLAFLEDGGLVTGVRIYTPAEGFGVRKYTASGQPDPAFGDNSLAAAPHASVNVPSAVAAQDGRIVVVGTTWAYYRVLGMSAFTTDGTVDTAFGDGGSYLGLGGPGEVTALGAAFDPDGRLLVRQRFDYEEGPGAGESSWDVLRFTAGGTFDPSWKPYLVAGGLGELSGDMVVDPGGRVVVTTRFDEGSHILAGLLS